MQTRNLGILAAATLVALAVAAMVQNGRDSSSAGNTGDSAAAGPLLPGLIKSINEVRRIEIAGPKGPVTLVYGAGPDGTATGGSDSRWSLAERDGYAADLDAVKNLVVGLAEAKKVEPRTASPELYARIGVEEPDTPAAASHRVMLKAADGRLVGSVVVGKTANPSAVGAGPRQTYMRPSGEARSWMVETPLDPITAEPTRWLDKKLPRLSRDELERITVAEPSGARLTLLRDPTDNGNFAAVGLPEGATLDKAAADAATAALAYLSFEDVVRADPAWFAAVPVYTLTAKTGVSVTVRGAKRDGAYWLALEATGAPGAPSLSGWAYRVYDAIGEDLTRPIAGYIATAKGE